LASNALMAKIALYVKSVAKAAASCRTPKAPSARNKKGMLH